MEKIDSMSAAQRQRKMRQDALRESIAATQHHVHAAKILEKVGDEAVEIAPEMVQRMKIAFDGHMKFINKYLPDLKAIEHTGEAGGDLVIGWRTE